MIKASGTIYNTIKRGFPIDTSGRTLMPKNMKFDLTNPYILDALPEGKSADYFVKYNGKDLKACCESIEKDLSNANKGFNKSELNALYKKAFPNIKVPSDVNCDAIYYVGMIPEEIGSKFDAKGISKISVTSQLKELNELLTNGIDKTRDFHTAPLVAHPGVGAGLGTSGSAYRDGSFIVVGDKSKRISDSGIKHVIVNDAYYNIINDLQRKFPDVSFVRADKAPEYFAKL